MNRYYQFFAGTYFFVLKVNFFGKNIIANRNYALTAITHISISETIVFLYVMTLLFGPEQTVHLPLIFGIAAAFWILNYFLVVRRDKYIGIIKRYKNQRSSLIWVAAIINFTVQGSLACLFFFLAARMP